MLSNVFKWLLADIKFVQLSIYIHEGFWKSKSGKSVIIHLKLSENRMIDFIWRPRLNYAYLRASNARASFVKVPEKIWGKNAHLARARVMGKWRADLWEQFFVGNDARASFVKVPEIFLGKNAY